ncbi:hypothetical protein SAMN05216244_0447 [Sediminibacillus halophilus]|uniref:Uncharacterized protein n=1 Tax=Sediminibacillus halophilus TaxID=482461 RepID=A0A1G9M701_9BACI|nr:hypothetical protein SAMN05216244_0447 [Sediminibacillus halophilus]
MSIPSEQVQAVSVEGEVSCLLLRKCQPFFNIPDKDDVPELT